MRERNRGMEGKGVGGRGDERCGGDEEYVCVSTFVYRLKNKLVYLVKMIFS